jgi:hypothetical protein
VLTAAGLHRVLDTQPDPPRWVAGLAAALAFLAVGDARVWAYTRHVITIGHEGGHAVVALLTGRRLQGIRLHADSSGLTVSSGRPSGPGMVATAFAGYVAPSMLGLAAAATVAANRVSALLWALVVLLLAMLLAIRNVFGVVAIVVTALVAAVLAWSTSPTVQGGAACTAAWVLLGGGCRAVVELHSQRRRGYAPRSDADTLGFLTPLPGGFWTFLFGLIAFASLAAGAFLLVRPA